MPLSTPQATLFPPQTQNQEQGVEQLYIRSSAAVALARSESSPSQEELYLAPDNFALVSPFVYRSGFPRKKNFSFIKRLGFKSILTLVLEEYPSENLEFLEENGINFFQFGVPGNKVRLEVINLGTICKYANESIDRGAVGDSRRNHPILIHCNKGKHRTGCLIACLRKLQHWTMAAIFDEYRRHSWPKSREMDMQCIEAFNVQRLWWRVWSNPELRAHMPHWNVLTEPWLRLEISGSEYEEDSS